MTKKDNELIVIGIGSSAGGLEALQELIAGLPPNIKNLSLIIAQHLSPSYKSMLADLLQKRTSYIVKEIENNEKIKAGIIYVTPPDNDSVVKSKHLYLSRPKTSVGPKPSVDLLFQSLAQEYGKNSVSVILSGTGSDGSFGVKAVHLAGGITVAQTPESARYNSMPISALETGSVTFTAHPAAIIGEILKRISSPQGDRNEEEPNQNDSDLQTIFTALEIKTGIDFSKYKISTISRRIAKRMSSLNLNSFHEYAEYIQDNDNESEELFNVMLIGVTEFFRDPEAFADLKVHLTRLLEIKSKEEPLRIWIPGCASGEEAYSISMLINMILGDEVHKYKIQIFATDVSESSIQTARNGVYPAQRLEKLSEETVHKFFTKKDNTYEVKKSVRQRILFSVHDITTHPPFLKLDLISCRNLLIYFSSALQKNIIPLFHYALQSDGLLFLGKSETVGEFSDIFAPLSHESRVFRKKTTTSLAKVKFPSIPTFRSEFSKVHVGKSELSIPELVKETLFNTFEHSYVVINENLEILEISGETTPWIKLTSGSMHANLIKMAHSDLQLELRALSLKAIKENKPQFSRLLKLTEDENLMAIQISVRPVIYSGRDNQLYLVIFEDRSSSTELKTGPVSEKSGEHSSRESDLEKELAATREQLQTFIEELETSNEELQSLNEEMQSANEELQSSNEELETSNEELQSSNEEIQIAYAELRQVNEQLQNKEQALNEAGENMRALIENSQEAFILIDTNYQILTLNEMASDIFKKLSGNELKANSVLLNSLPQREFSELFGNLKKGFNGEKVASEIEFYTTVGAKIWLQYQIYPVHKELQPVSRLSLTFLDVTLQHEQQRAIQEKSYVLNSIFDSADIGISLIDSQGKFHQVNEAFCKTYDYTEKQLIGQDFTVLIPAEDRRSSKKFFTDLLAGAKSYSREWKMQRKDGVMLDVYRTQSVVRFPDGAAYIVTTERDVSESRHYRDLLEQTQETVKVGGWELDLITGENRWTEEVYTIYDLDHGVQPNPEHGLSYYQGESREKLRLALDSAIQRGESFDLELEFLSERRIKKWVRSTCRPVRVYNKTVKLYGTIQDITHKKVTEKEIGKLSMVASRIRNGVIITDENGLIDWVNEGFTNMSGFTLEEVKGKKPGWILQGKNTDLDTVNHIRDQLKKLNAFSVEILNYRRDKSPFWLRIEFTPIKNSLGKLISYVGIQTDITEQKEYSAYLEKSLKEKEVLLKEIHHRVKNNMAIISSLLGLQSVYNPDPNLSRILEDSRSRISSMALIHEKLYRSNDLSGISFEVYLKELADSIISSYQSSDIQIGIRYALEEVTLDIQLAMPLGLILHEALLNACRHAFQGRNEGQIILTMRKTDKRIKVTVQDNGIGVQKKNTAEASSLGLTLIAGLTDQVNGSHSLNSTKGGTIFEVDIPYEPNTVTIDEKRSTRGKGDASKDKKERTDKDAKSTGTKNEKGKPQKPTPKSSGKSQSKKTGTKTRGKKDGG